MVSMHCMRAAVHGRLGRLHVAEQSNLHMTDMDCCGHAALHTSGAVLLAQESAFADIMMHPPIMA